MIRTDRIVILFGVPPTVIESRVVTSTALTFHPRDKIRLRIGYERIGKRKLQVVGVPAKVDLDKLAALLPVKPSIRDARRRAIRQTP